MTYKLKDRQYNGLTTKNKGRNNDPQTPSQNIKDRAALAPPLKPGERTCSERVGSSCSTNDTRRVTLVTNQEEIYDYNRKTFQVMTST
jgi:hypothetical protein